MSQDYLNPSVVEWFRTNADQVLRNIWRATYGNEGTETDRQTLFRPEPVYNATQRGFVSQTVERLIRWDDRRPEVVFRDGFPPWVTPAQGENASVNAPDSPYNLERYMRENVHSIFVGTARYYRDDVGATRLWEDPGIYPGRPVHSGVLLWEPRVNPGFAYEIFAFGGIDVDELFAGNTTYPYRSQHEIAFPGGIRREFIRSAREYNADGTVAAYWDNDNFNPMANGPRSQALNQYPRLIRRTDHPVHSFLATPATTDPDTDHDTDPEHDELRRRRRATDKDYMRTEGSSEPDDSLDHTSRPSVTCFPDPTESTNAYFFYANQYALIKVKPGTTDDSIIQGPTIVNGPKDISTEWPSLAKAGFKTVDAVLPNPKNSDEAYFFFDKQYALIKVAPGTTDDAIVNGPKTITDNWPSLKDAGFEVVDACLANPDNSEEAYFFSGDKYVLIKVEPATTDDTIVNGPKLIAGNWPSLVKAGFWK
ncbi:hypothetical protein C8R44DRAFT_831600 [Mycena epipterygia]|nr:hypothetical protein C8R44DRAFT_831600 [Mycena epipterygia]